MGELIIKKKKTYEKYSLMTSTNIPLKRWLKDDA
jgi:hypothetical protein